MVSGLPTPQPEPSLLPKPGSPATKPTVRGKPLLDGAIFLFLALFAILLPHSIKGAQHAWQIAFVLWLLKLVWERRRPFRQPLAAPLLAYVVLSAISTALSPNPYLSWDRMKIVCLVLVGVVVGQNLERLSQVRILVFLLILSGLAAAGFTAWQYTYGVGAQVKYILPGTPLYQAGVRHDDIITSVNDRRVHTPEQFERAVLASPPTGLLRIDLVRGFPFRHEETYVSRKGLAQSGFGTPSLQFGRGKPLRAQGTLGHYVILAEMLMQIGCIMWALLLAIPSAGTRIFLGIAFVALGAALMATQTRAAAAGLALGCLVALLMLAGRRSRTWATSALIVLVLGAAFWIQRTRGLHWLDRSDPGTNFRVLMWEDGIRLAREHPWFGVGMETIRVHWQEWNIRGLRLYPVMSHFHSDAIQIAAERGLPTLAAWLWFLGAYAWFLFRLVGKARQHSRFAAGVAAGLLAGLVAFLVPSLVHYNMGEESLVMMFFFYYGLGVAVDHMLEEPGAIDVP